MKPWKKRGNQPDLLKAEHGRNGIIANVVADPNPPTEDLHSSMLIEAIIQQDALLFHSWQDDGDVVGGRCELRKLDIGIGLFQTYTAQFFTFLPIKSCGVR